MSYLWNSLETLLNGEKIVLPQSQKDLLTEALTAKEIPDAVLEHIEWVEPQDAIVLFSGGLDSFLTYRLFTSSVKALYIDFGHSYAPYEEHAARQLVDDLWIVRVNVPFINFEHIMPARNLLAIEMAQQFLEPTGRIFFSTLFGEMPESGGDKSVRFLDACA